jgi:hypothetical protein
VGYQVDFHQVSGRVRGYPLHDDMLQFK